MGKAGEWRPGDIANVLDSASKITGNIPDLIKAIGTLEDDIIKAGGESIKSGGEGIAKVLDTVDKMDNQTTGGTQVDGTLAATPPASISQPFRSSLMGLPPMRLFTDSEQERRRDPSVTTALVAATGDDEEVRS